MLELAARPEIGNTVPARQSNSVAKVMAAVRKLSSNPCSALLSFPQMLNRANKNMPHEVTVSVNRAWSATGPTLIPEIEVICFYYRQDEHMNG